MAQVEKLSYMTCFRDSFLFVAELVLCIAIGEVVHFARGPSNFHFLLTLILTSPRGLCFHFVCLFVC